MISLNKVPTNNYGVIHKDVQLTELDVITEEFSRNGFVVIDSGYSEEDIINLSKIFNKTHLDYIKIWGEDRLRTLNEYNIIRAPLTFADKFFLEISVNERLLKIIRKLISGKFILNQQNAIINPSNEKYNQGCWHRDLPYQHFVSTSPLAISALFCIDDFTLENGATFVLPASHKSSIFPSEAYIKKNAKQIQTKKGQFILMDSMVYHSGGFNGTNCDRRAINNIYTIPFFKQQIRLPELLLHLDLNLLQKEIFGFEFIEPLSINQFLNKEKNL